MERVHGDEFLGLHVLADDDPRWKRDPVEQARAACEGGASVIQLRSKHGGDARALEWARAIRKLTRDCGASFVINDRFDLALAAGADGVHLGQTDLPPSCVPAIRRRGLAVGRSTHSLEQARAACDEPVDYIAFGPVFETHSKLSEYSRRGLAALSQIATLVAPRPLVAIGGINAANAAAVAAAGATGVAVISAVAGAEDPGKATRGLVRQLNLAAIRAPEGAEIGGEA